VHTLDASPPEERGRHRRAGVPGSDHCDGPAVAHCLGGTYEGRIRARPHRARRILVHADHVGRAEDLDAGGRGAAGKMWGDRVGATDEQDVDVALLGRTERARDDLARRAVASHRVDRDHGRQ
jgi:hypothetical protein